MSDLLPPVLSSIKSLGRKTGWSHAKDGEQVLLVLVSLTGIEEFGDFEAWLDTRNSLKMRTCEQYFMSN